MAEMHFKEKDRLALSIFLALALHAIAFLLMQFFITRVSPIPEYSGPVFVELVGAESLQPDTQPEETLAEEQPEEEPVAEQPEEIPPVIEEPESGDGTDLIVTATLRPTATARQTAARTVRSVTKKATQIQTNKPTQRQTKLQAVTVVKTAAATPSPTEESALGGDVLASLDKVLGSTSTVKAQPTGKPAATRTTSVQGKPGSSGTGGITADIKLEGKETNRVLDKQPEPVLPNIKDLPPVLTVELSFSVTPQGFLQKIKIEKSSGYTAVDNAVGEALQKYKFAPVTGGEPVTGAIIFQIKTK